MNFLGQITLHIKTKIPSHARDEINLAVPPLLIANRDPLSTGGQITDLAISFPGNAGIASQTIKANLLARSLGRLERELRSGSTGCGSQSLPNTSLSVYGACKPFRLTFLRLSLLGWYSVDAHNYPQI
jgi:hypothetical protein